MSQMEEKKLSNDSDYRFSSFTFRLFIHCFLIKSIKSKLSRPEVVDALNQKRNVHVMNRNATGYRAKVMSVCEQIILRVFFSFYLSLSSVFSPIAAELYNSVHTHFV